MFPQSHIVENEVDIVLAILAGETVTRCCGPNCNHWGRKSNVLSNVLSNEFRWWCQCCAKKAIVEYSGPEHRDFLCDGTRV